MALEHGELVSEIKALNAQRKRVDQLEREIRIQERALLDCLEEMEARGLVEWPEDIPRRS